MNDEIRKKAIEAALNSLWGSTFSASEAAAMKRAIDAYEKALWRPIEELPQGIGWVIGDWGAGRGVAEWHLYGGKQKPIRFRPFPVPPEVT